MSPISCRYHERAPDDEVELRPRRSKTIRVRRPLLTPHETLTGRLPSERDRFLITVLAGDPLGSVARVDEDPIVVGRGDGAGLVLGDPGLSWAHARLCRKGEQVFVEDLGSTNGTFVGEHRITEPTALGDGARIRLGGHTVLKLLLADELEEASARRLYESTVRDALTLVHNRRYLEERIASEASFATRHQTSFAIILMDIDHFKRVNDRHGHQIGDAVLRLVATAIQRIVRPEDVLARFGGDEFVVLARSLNRDSARILAERIREHIVELELPFIRTASASLGVAVVEGDRARTTPDGLLRQADAAMYEAKRTGRNRVVVV